MKRFFLCFNIFICCTCATYAQLNLLNISDYERPFIKRQALGINIGSDGSNSFGEGSFFAFSETTQNNFRVNGKLSYHNYRNSQKYQGTHSAISRYSGSSNKTIVPSTTANINSVSTAKFQNLYTDISSTNYFYNNKNYFLLGEINIYHSNTNSKETQEFSGVPDIENKRKSNSIATSLEVGIGKGRIDPISDVYLAIYLIKALQKNNRLTKELSPEETLAFAQHIAQVKNRRVLDSRLKRIYEMEAIDSFFVENQLINDADATYFATLADLLPFGYFPDRHKGSLISLSFVPQYDLNTSDLTVSYSYKQKINRLLGKINYRYYKPIKLKYLWTIDASILFGKNSHKTDHTYVIPSDITIIDENSQQFLMPSIQTSFSYFPNTRTEIKGTIYGLHTFEEQSADIIILNFGNIYTTSLSTELEAFYWFSPKLNLQASYRFLIGKSHYDNQVGTDRYRRNMRGYLSLNYNFF